MLTPEPQQDNLGLGIDAGGTQTRWALAAPGGRIVAEGTVGGLSALQMASAEGREAVQATFGAIARDVLVHGRPVAVRAGVTGYGGDGGPLQHCLGGLLGLDPKAVVLSNDIEIAYLASFRPGEGYLVYSGTGSIGAFIDAGAIGAGFPEEFAAVFAACMRAGLDPRVEPIPIAAAAHYHMGGIVAGPDGRTSLPGLFAVGECAATGVHGANRLASNSLLEAAAFGRRRADGRFDAGHGLGRGLAGGLQPPDIDEGHGQIGGIRAKRGTGPINEVVRGHQGFGGPERAELEGTGDVGRQIGQAQGRHRDGPTMFIAAAQRQVQRRAAKAGRQACQHLVEVGPSRAFDQVTEIGAMQAGGLFAGQGRRAQGEPDRALGIDLDQQVGRGEREADETILHGHGTTIAQSP